MDRGLVRPMCVGDLHHVSRIEKESSTLPWSISYFRDALSLGYYCFVARNDQAILGYAVTALASVHAYLLNLCVAGGARRKGYGRMLVEHCIQSVVVYGATSLWLKVAESNYPARDLYSKCGFQYWSVSHDYYPTTLGREDALILRIQLDQAAPSSLNRGQRLIESC